VAVPHARVRVVVARFEDLVDRGLQALLAEDDHVELCARSVPHERVQAAIAEHRPQVALLNYGSLRSPLEVRELVAAHPGTHLVVLANRPSPQECSQMLAFGATACLSKETQGRDVINAIHLASRGMHVLPRSAGGGGGSNSHGIERPRAADAARGRRARPAAERALERRDRGRAARRRRDRSHPRAQHLSQARGPLASRAGADVDGAVELINCLLFSLFV
jgi:DNA-binding NarL/FixJ family response regulator